MKEFIRMIHSSTKFFKRINYEHLFWLFLALGIILSVITTFRTPKLFGLNSMFEQISIWLIIFGLLIIIFLVIKKFIQLGIERKELIVKVHEAELNVQEARQQKEAILQVSKRFVEASDERDVIELVLKLSIDQVGASGASFVPLDVRGQPLTAVSMGELPFPVVNDWVEYLASPSIRERCQFCKTHGEISTNCPLLTGPLSDAIGMFCLPLKRGTREFGVLNVYLVGQSKMDDQTRDFLRVMVDETALALEGIQLRRREIEGLSRMQAVRQKTDLQSILETLLDNTSKMVDANFATLFVFDKANAQTRIHFSVGEIEASSRLFIDGIIKSVSTSHQPVIFGDVTVNPQSGGDIHSILAVPCHGEVENIHGALLVGSRDPASFQPRQIILLQTVADQIVQIIDNTDLLANLEYKTMMEERTRLAREIHDGLAQTLGFLKLQLANIRNHFEKEDMVKLKEGLDICYTTTNEAYVDARQAIDGLRIWPDQVDLSDWLKQISDDFEETSGIHVKLNTEPLNDTVPPEIQAQLTRIIQESFSNIRKHAKANQAEIFFNRKGGELLLEIKDDGIGFTPDDVSIRSQHGLTGMRERAELIGADFQIISQEGTGTIIRLVFPFENSQTSRMEA